MCHRKRVAAALVLAAAMTAPTAAQATVTIGSNLGRAPNGSTDCGGTTCTLAVRTLAPSELTPNGLVSPVNGTVVRWSIRTGAFTGQTALRVIRRFPGNLVSGLATSGTETPPLNDTKSFPTSLPIAIGDEIGIDCCATQSAFEVAGTTGDRDELWFPALANGGPPRAPEGTTGVELALNADIEPTAAFTVGGIKKGKRGKLTVTATLPNPGVLEGGDVRDASLAAAAAKKKTRYLKHSSLQIGAPGTVRLQVLPTKAARQALRSRAKLRAKLKLRFTPTGGTPATQTIKVKLKR